MIHLWIILVHFWIKMTHFGGYWLGYFWPKPPMPSKFWPKWPKWRLLESRHFWSFWPKLARHWWLFDQKWSGKMTSFWHHFCRRFGQNGDFKRRHFWSKAQNFGQFYCEAPRRWEAARVATESSLRYACSSRIRESNRLAALAPRALESYRLRDRWGWR